MARLKTILLALLTAVFAVGGGALPGSLAQERRPQSLAVVPTGPVETVFDWPRDVCVKTHVPDAPARAFRNADGEVSLILSHSANRALVGPSLDQLKPRCSVLYEGRRSPELIDFDDISWIGGVFTRDGRTVYALAHTELRGERKPGQCPAGRYSACLLNTITSLVSQDGGQHFMRVDRGRPPVVATLPYDFPTDRNDRVGYSNPSNIIEHDGWLYAFIFADSYKDQRRGSCLIRTRTPDDPSSWRAWNGKDFSVAFLDPFRDAIDDARGHVCAPVAPNIIGRLIGGVVSHRETGSFIAVFGDKRRGRDGRVVEGIFSSTSPDLLTWSEPSLVMEVRLLWDPDCAEPQSYFYPSLIDPDARTPSFEDIGGSGFLYLTRYQLQNCKVTWDRDLVRVPVTIRKGP